MTENKGDLISREALIEKLKERYYNDGLNIVTAIELINNAPTVDDKTKDDTPAGTWIPEEETYTDLSGTIETYTRFKCDSCMQGQNFGPYPFCPWCGKKMQKETKT